MAKLLKKMTVFLFMLGVAFVVFAPMRVNAEEERVAVYVQVPKDWDGPCAWAWDEAGKNAFAAWPGGELEADVNNEGWYYIWIPSWANHLIINAGEGSVQTGELLLEGGNAWVTVADADNAEISYDALTKGDIPEYVEKFSLHVSVPEGWKEPCLWAWSAPDGKNAFEAWPGEALKKGDDGWYAGKAPVWVNSIIVNGNEGSVQTEDISIDPAEIWVTVEEDGSYEFSYNDPDAAEAPDIHVYVKAPGDWESPCLWAWSAPDGTNVFASWPGEAFAEGEGGWLTMQVPGWVNSVIVNGNEGSVQTTDISVETGKDIWLVVTGPEEYEVSYEEPAIEETGEAGAEENAETETAQTPSEEPDQAPKAEGGGVSTIVWVVVIFVIIAALAAFFILKKKK